jgi:soluble lytic murein transglycosylase-like protein
LNRRRIVIIGGAAAALLLAVILAAVFAARERAERRRLRSPASTETAAAPAAVPPVEKWTETFERLNGDELASLLAAIEQKHPDLYAKWSLGYVHARALIEADEDDDAVRKLEPFLKEGNPFRELALYDRASVAEGEEASRFRRELLKVGRREDVIEDEIDYLASLEDPSRLIAFANEQAPKSSTDLRRLMSARIVEKTLDLDRALALLQGSTTDDASDRAARAIDRKELIAKMKPDQHALLGETMQSHRHYDRAAALLSLALKAKYSDELQYALGRSHYGAEEYAEAEQAYLRGAQLTKDPKQQCTFFWHAARAAQLRGDDARAEQLMTQAVAVKGKHPSTLPALTQRLRTRLKQKRAAQAAADLALVRKLAPNERAVYEASLAYAVGVLAMGNRGGALSVLDSIPPALMDDYDDAEVAYWRGRALEASDPSAAIRAYLSVLNAQVASHFVPFAEARLRGLARHVERENRVRDAQVRNLLAAKKFELAKKLQTDRVHLSTSDRATALKTLESIYRELPAYREVLELTPIALPRFPVEKTDRDTLLMAMGLHGDAADAVERRWGLRPAREALTRSLALHRGGASRASIYAVEVMMRSVPRDFHPELLPPVVRQLLYPRYFYTYIVEDADRYDADPALVLSIMREESRFNPRAKSQAAARGLLQFIITTARDIGRDVGLVDLSPEDLYDPRVIIRLGAKYIAELSEEFGGNRYRATAAYNAGPKQVALWTRMQPGEGDDYFLTAINFDETKHYVRKVMHSYRSYEAVYQ